MNRSEHLQWCKDRAVKYIDGGDVKNGIASFLLDMRRHEETKDHKAIDMMMALMFSGGLDNPVKAKEFILGFN